MVYLAVTPRGLADALRIAGMTEDAVWCGADAISEADYKDLFSRKKGLSLSRFVHDLGDGYRLEDALSTIAEHHPGHTIWLERAD